MTTKKEKICTAHGLPDCCEKFPQEERLVFSDKPVHVHYIPMNCQCDKPEERSGWDLKKKVIDQWKKDYPYMNSLIERTIGDLRYKDFNDGLEVMVDSALQQERREIVELAKKIALTTETGIELVTIEALENLIKQRNALPKS